MRHFDSLVEILSKPGMLSTTFPKIEERTLPAFVRLLLGLNDSYNQFLYLVYADDGLLGIVGATIRRGIAEVGCILTPAFRGRGLGYTAHELLFSAVLCKRPDVKDFIAVTAVQNTAAIRMLLALGFTNQKESASQGLPEEHKLIFRRAASNSVLTAPSL